jgi:hypothetical protein
MNRGVETSEVGYDTNWDEDDWMPFAMPGSNMFEVEE